ncbi:MAG TPA: UbiA family prenyltransferase [Gemmatimonadales bacterium]
MGAPDAVGAAAPAPPVTERGLARWVTYQRERFPVLGHGALILAFSSGAVCYSASLRASDTGEPFSVSAASLVVAFVSCFLFFFQLRVSDELKDLEEDRAHRPYRPVPRGLVTLGELGALALVGMAVQLALAFWLEPMLVLPLALVWAYMALMTKEFWLHDWLARRPVTVLWTHMLVMPLIDLYATACDWMATGEGHVSRAGLGWFLAASFFNGMVVEIGRKLRAPEDEERGVSTYTAIWGRDRAVLAWFGVMAVTLVCASLAALAVDALPIVLGLVGAIGLAAVGAGARLAITPRPGMGKRLELIAGLWTIALYLGLGVVPAIVRAWS